VVPPLCGLRFHRENRSEEGMAIDTWNLVRDLEDIGERNRMLNPE
jgi:hypothetical protein